MKNKVRNTLAAVMVCAVAGLAAVSQAQQKLFYVEEPLTNYQATVIHGTNSATGTILDYPPAGYVYSRITIRPTGRPIVLGFISSASTNAMQYGVGTNWTWTASDVFKGPFLTNSITARDANGATNATSTAGVEAWGYKAGQ